MVDCESSQSDSEEEKEEQDSEKNVESDDSADEGLGEDYFEDQTNMADDDEEMEEDEFDPRAGHVDVILPQLNIDCRECHPENT